MWYIALTFRSNNKCSLLKNLCTLAFLLLGNPPSTTYTQLLWNKISLTSSLTIAISYFLRAGMTSEQGEGRTDITIALRSPTCAPHIHCSPPHLPLIHCKGKPHAALRHSASLRAAGGMFPFHFTKCTHLVIPLILTQPIPFISLLESVA